MDLFGRKAQARIAELEQENKLLRQDLSDAMKSLRNIDQGIFDMSQKPDWPAMRPIFAKLCEATNVRMMRESKRIASLILPEIESTYK